MHFGAIVIAIAAAGSCSALAADYGVIAEQNLFDPQRKPWPEPEAPAAASSPLGPEDLQVQGVVVHGGVKRAIVRLGGRLRALAPGAAAGRYNVVLREGQTLGGYTLESAGVQQLVFASGGKRFTVPFTRSARRELASAAPAPLPVIQSATLPVAEPRFAPAAQGARRTTPRPVQTPATMARPPAQTPAPAPGEQTGAATPASSGSAATPAPPAGGMSLLQAIQAAEAARRAGQAPAAPPPYNPFAPRTP